MTNKRIYFKENSDNPAHNLWNNNGTWYIHYTVYPTENTAERVRHSLKTKNFFEACAKRDHIFAKFLLYNHPSEWPGRELIA